VGGAEHNGRSTADKGDIGPVVHLEPGPLLHPAGSPARPPSSPEPADNRVAVVSGGNRGLGLQIVRLLAERGMRVVLGSRSLERGRAAVGSLDTLADRVAVRQLDITDVASVTRFAIWLGRRLGRCDVLVNNAAVLLDDDRDPTTANLDVVRRTLETNLLGTWRLIQAVTPLMRISRYGRIVNVSSGLASLATTRRGLPAYRVAKCAVNSLTRVLADELAEDGILVNACCPSRVLGDVPDPHTAIRLPVSPDTPVWLATLPDGGPTGGFYRGRRPINW
jgi:NAD(P)-dependent dehydrogenase (short-subunit alcohol dehydrogenase family)